MGIKHRVVLDTNVLISASFRKISSTPNTIYQALKDQKFILVTTSLIIEELEDVLNRDYIIERTYMTRGQRKKFIQELIDISVVVSGDSNMQIVQDDPDDDKFIAAAIEGQADYIVSGDKPLLNIKEYQGIKIISPADFVKLLD